MSSFLETYGVAIFTLVLVAILIAFAGPLGMKIKNATTDKVSQTEQIGCDEITVATGKTVRPTKPAEAVDQVYCIYYDDGEMTISQNEIEPETGRTVVKKGFYSMLSSCTTKMTTVRFVGAVMPKTCYGWFYDCTKLTEIKNIENLYTNECTNMNMMFGSCSSLTNLDVSNFDTSNVEAMQAMFLDCNKLTNIDVSKWNTNKVQVISSMFSHCSSLTSLDLSNWNLQNLSSGMFVFDDCNSLTTKSVKISQATHDKIINNYRNGITADKFDIVK